MNAKVEQVKQQATKPSPAQAGTVAKITEIGNYGFIIFDGNGYYYVTEADWRALEPVSNTKPTDQFVLAVSSKSVFINLDLIDEAPAKNT